MAIIGAANILYNSWNAAKLFPNGLSDVAQPFGKLADTAATLPGPLHFFLPPPSSLLSAAMQTVADLCREHQIDVPQLAQRSGLEEGRTLAIVLGRWTPSPTERQKIAAVFDVPPDQISWGHKTPIQHLYGHGPG